MTNWTTKKIRIAEKGRLNRDYVPLAVAAQITGVGEKKIIPWAEEHSVHHYKYLNRWYFSKTDLARALKDVGNQPNGMC